MTSPLTLDGPHALVHHCSKCYARALLDSLVEERAFDLARDVYVLLAKHHGVDSATQVETLARVDRARDAVRASGN